MGPMFSGKTTELLRLTERHERAGRPRKLIKPIIDERYSKSRVDTHDKRSHEALRANCLAEVIETIEERVIGIDEGQFFPDLIEGCLRLVGKGKIVVVAGLSSDAEMKPFGQMLNLLAVCEYSVKLNAVCKDCGEEAPFTVKIGGSDVLVDVGSEDKYKAVCRSCYTESKASIVSHIEHKTVKEELPPSADTETTKWGTLWARDRQEKRALVTGPLLHPQLGSSPPRLSSIPEVATPRDGGMSDYPIDCPLPERMGTTRPTLTESQLHADIVRMTETSAAEWNEIHRLAAAVDSGEAELSALASLMVSKGISTSVLRDVGLVQDGATPLNKSQYHTDTVD